MSTAHDRLATLADLRSRWGAAAPRPAVEVFGALAIAPLPLGPEVPGIAPAALPAGEPVRPVPLPGGTGLPTVAPRPDRSGTGAVVPTGFAALDALLGAGGLARPLTATLAGDPGSGRTTLALRIAAEAQAAGCLVAYVDAARSLDPVEAAARGVVLDQLVVCVPRGVADGVDLGAELLRSGTVDVLLLDLPDGSVTPGDRLPERLLRLAAHARRSGALLVVLQPPGVPQRVAGALAEASGLRLRLRRRAWIRLGREVVGQRTEVVVEKERAGPPGGRAELRILYAEGGARDRCLLRPHLLHDRDRDAIDPHAPPSPHLAVAPHRSRAFAHGAGGSGHRDAGRGDGDRGADDGADRPRRDAVDGRAGPRREPGGAGDGRPARDAARERAAAGA